MAEPLNRATLSAAERSFRSHIAQLAFRPVVPSRHAFGSLQQVRKTQLPLRQRRVASVRVPGAEAAIECFLLMTFLALILFHAFLYLNVKPSLRQGKFRTFWAKVMAAEIYQDFILAAPSP
jgi:hypothetical protein